MLADMYSIPYVVFRSIIWNLKFIFVCFFSIRSTFQLSCEGYDPGP
jgi:hypothetical protein